VADAIRVLVCGAAGQMGRFVVQAVRQEPEMKLTGAVDITAVGQDAGALASGEVTGTPIMDDLDAALERARPDVMVDFTSPAVVLDNIKTALEHNVRIVVGTTGLDDEALEAIEKDLVQRNLGGVVCPNFSLGANLMMLASELLAKYYPYAEIIELHHEKKKDAPSGTALATAKLIAQARAKAGYQPATPPGPAVAARGLVSDKIPIHSVRLPGYVANQEVLFSDAGEVVTIKHESTSRVSFMPGVLMAIKFVMHTTGLTRNLRDILLAQK